MTENDRTQTARDTDDSALIDSAIADADTGAIAGDAHGIHADIDKQAALREIAEPDATVRPTKQDDIDNGQAYDSDRRGDRG